MSARDVWKAMSLLYVGQRKQKGLNFDMLNEAGIDCYADTVATLLDCGAIEEVDGTFVLSRAARMIFHTCTVGHRKWSGANMWVDYPLAFVVMPFSESWSDVVYKQMIKPAVDGARLDCIRADEAVQVGGIRDGLWDLILEAGIVVADVSELNANVFYELGLVHALGKDSILIKRQDTKVPADFAGALYREYDMRELESGRSMLQTELENWSKRNGADGVTKIICRR